MGCILVLMKQEIKTRSTKTKGVVEELLQKNHSPLSLEEIYKLVKKQLPKTAYSTVYRIIRKLESQGLLIRTDWKDRGGKFELANRPHHHHLVCESCDSVVDIDDKILNFNEKNVSKNTGFIIKNHSIELTGVCSPCQDK